MPEQLALVPAGPRLVFRQRVVPERRLADALYLLETFNRTMGTRLTPLRRSGAPSPALSRILGALSDVWPPITLSEGVAMIEAAARRPWWNGTPSTGVVFGRGAVDQAREQARARPAVERPRTPREEGAAISAACLAQLMR
jgi:hypothetical protein